MASSDTCKELSEWGQVPGKPFWLEEKVTGTLDEYAGLIFLLHPQVKSLDYKNHCSQQKEDSKDSAEAKITQTTKWQQYSNDKEALPPKSKRARSSSATFFNHYLEILKKKLALFKWKFMCSHPIVKYLLYTYTKLICSASFCLISIRGFSSYQYKINSC